MRKENGIMKLWNALAVCIFAYLHTFSFAYSSPAVSVWRGETAYVDIPAGCGERGTAVAMAMAGEPGNGERDGVSVTLGYYDEVAYEMQPDGVDIRKRPDVYRDCENVELCKYGNMEVANGKQPTVCKIVVSADAKPGVYAFGSLKVTVVDRVLPPAKD